MADGRELRTIPAHDSWVGAVLFSPDNHAVMSRGGDRSINVWDIVTGHKLHSFAAGGTGAARHRSHSQAMAARSPPPAATMASGCGT